MNKPQLSIGTRVAYRAAHLRSIGVYSGPLPFDRGTLTKELPNGLWRITWDDGSVSHVLESNLIAESKIGLEPN